MIGFRILQTNSITPKDIVQPFRNWVKILNFNGEIDINENFYNEYDLIMASVHRFPEKPLKILKIKAFL